MTLTAVAPANELINTDKYKTTLSKYLKRDVIKKGVNNILEFTKEQAKISSNILQFKVGEMTGLNDGLNKGNQLLKTVVLGG